MNTTQPRVIFRADGNASLGLGHVVRCLALADMLHPGFATIFAIQDPAPGVRVQIEAVCEALWSVPAFAEPTQEADWLLHRLQPTDILVLDGYHFGPAYAYTFWVRQQPVVWLDDLAAHYLWSDVVINHAGGGSADRYAAITVPGAERCLGPAYALLRRPFQQATQQPTAAPDTSRIFVNMGGADPDNHTLRLLLELRRRFPDKTIEVVTGAAYPHQAALAQQAAALPGVVLHHAIDADELVHVLQRCGLHICPPSGMAYECCAVGGLLFLYPIADNQRYLLAYLTEAGLALPYSDLTDLSETELLVLAPQAVLRQRHVFDGATAARFQRVFHNLHTATGLALRRAQPTDALQYFTWANDAEVRRNAIHTAPIEWDTHLGWFSRRLQDPDSFLYIFEQAGQPVGQVRLEFAGAEATIDYSVAAAFRGQGMGAAVLRRALRQLRLDKPGTWAVLGQVRSGNLPSCRVFQRLGFTQRPAIRLHDEPYEVFRLEVAPAAVS